MKLTSIGAPEIQKCLEAAAAVIVAKEPRLNALDSAIGDGDHGITMRIGFESIRQKLSVLPESTGIGEVLKEAGSAFMGATGGAIGPLLGGMLRSGDKVLSGKGEMGPLEFKLWLDAMEASLSRMGKAKPGDKTILDAVHAACQAVSQTGSEDIAEACAKAAEAAARAAQSTANMLSVKGRSSRLGERVLGHPDPGAVSFSLILEAFANFLKQEHESSV
ncbi:MAG: dihydroxyacetone kinase subunit DhaL [Terriglobia bacterium]